MYSWALGCGLPFHTPSIEHFHPRNSRSSEEKIALAIGFNTLISGIPCITTGLFERAWYLLCRMTPAGADEYRCHDSYSFKKCVFSKRRNGPLMSSPTSASSVLLPPRFLKTLETERMTRDLLSACQELIALRALKEGH